MKTIQILCIALLIFSCSDDDAPIPNIVEAACLTNTLGNSIIAFYPFNGGALTDESGDNHNLLNTTNASSTSDRNGNPNCAYKFDNSQTAAEFLTTSNSDFLNGLNEFSISVWYQPMDSTIIGVTTHGIFSRGNEGRCPNRIGEWSMSLFDCRRAVFGHDNSVWAFPVTNFVNGCDGEAEELVDKWHHVVGIKNGNEYKIYFNGVLNETDTDDANCNNFQPAQDLGDVFVGFKFTGKIDDIIIYDREILQSEVTELFELESCCQ